MRARFRLLDDAVKEPDEDANSADKAKEGGASEHLVRRLHRSARLWSLCADLEEHAGTLQGARDAYDSMLRMKIATVNTVLMYAQMLAEKKYFEDSFKVYERGIAAFKWPHVEAIWSAYLNGFIARYSGTKSRARPRAIRGRPRGSTAIICNAVHHPVCRL